MCSSDLLVDTADLNEIATALRLPGVQGITTNPTLVARACGATALARGEYQSAVTRLLQHLDNLAPSRTIQRIVMVQGIGGTADILDFARHCMSHVDPARWQLWIKLLPTWGALSAIDALRESGVRSIVTAVFSPAQARVAMAAGADGIAVYVGRLQAAESTWATRLKELRSAVPAQGRTFLLASFPDLKTVEIGRAHV